MISARPRTVTAISALVLPAITACGSSGPSSSRDSAGSSQSGGAAFKLTKCFVNSSGDQEVTVDVTGVPRYVASVDLYAANGQYETRLTPTAISPQFNPASASSASGPVDGSTFTCHLASVIADGTSVYTDAVGGQPQPNGPVPPGINLTG